MALRARQLMGTESVSAFPVSVSRAFVGRLMETAGGNPWPGPRGYSTPSCERTCLCTARLRPSGGAASVGCSSPPDRGGAHAVASASGGPASEYGRLCHSDRGREGGERHRRGLELAVLTAVSQSGRDCHAAPLSGAKLRTRGRYKGRHR